MWVAEREGVISTLFDLSPRPANELINDLHEYQIAASASRSFGDYIQFLDAEYIDSAIYLINRIATAEPENEINR